MHPDFMKNATSEQSIFVGMKLGLPNLLHTPLASSASVKAKAKAFSQVTAKRALAAGLYSTPTRQRTKFKADMIDETSDLDPSLQSLQPFGSSHVGVSDAADNFAPFTPPLRERSRSPVNEPGESSIARSVSCSRCPRLIQDVPEGIIRTFAGKPFHCSLVGNVCLPRLRRRAAKVSVP